MRLRIISEHTHLIHKLRALRPEIAQRAQIVYDNWVEDEGGGICDEIADAISSVLAHEGIETTEGGHDGDDHAFVIAYDEVSSFAVDVPPQTYEIGGGYSWTKIPDVVFSPNDVIIAQVDRPDWIDDDF